MGIREEIEKLRSSIVVYDLSTAIHVAVYGRAIADVLSVLDKWECVKEKQFPDDDLCFAEMYEFVLDVYEATKAGDQIIIWRRDESGS